MKPITIFLCLAVCGFCAHAPVVFSQDSNTLVGTWMAIDPNDGSTGYFAITGPLPSYGSSGDGQLEGSFVDSKASQACGEASQEGVPFLGDIYILEPSKLAVTDLVPGGYLDIRVRIAGQCLKKSQASWLDARLRYFGDTDTVRLLGNDWQRYVLDPDVFRRGVKALRNDSTWLVADLIMDADERRLHNGICAAFSTLMQPPPEYLVMNEDEFNCGDGLDNDCDGLVDWDDETCLH